VQSQEWEDFRASQAAGDAAAGAPPQPQQQQPQQWQRQQQQAAGGSAASIPQVDGAADSESAEQRARDCSPAESVGRIWLPAPSRASPSHPGDWAARPSEAAARTFSWTDPAHQHASGGTAAAVQATIAALPSAQSLSRAESASGWNGRRGASYAGLAEQTIPQVDGAADQQVGDAPSTALRTSA